MQSDDLCWWHDNVALHVLLKLKTTLRPEALINE